MKETSYIELSRSALKNNIRYIRNLVGKDCKISHVVKGNAYGHGIDEFAPLAASLGASHFSTFDASEAQQVLNCTDNVEIMIMGMIDNEQVEWAIENNIQYYVFEMDRLEVSVKNARKIGKKALIHIELETGMNRTGFEIAEWKNLHKYIRENINFLEIKGICTHYAGAEHASNFPRIDDQYKTFMKGVKFFKKKNIEPELLHSACSASSLRLPYTHMDMVRIGILQYGFWPSNETYITTVKPGIKKENPLKRVISWKSRVMSVKSVEQGQYVGYGTSFITPRKMQIAAVPVGYGYGYSRSLSNTGRALVKGKIADVVGIVNMNVMMIDVTGFNVEKGDEVVLIGKQGKNVISVSAFGDFSNQLNYELLTRLPDDIPRIIVN